MSPRHQRKIGTAQQVLFPISPDFDFCVHIRKALFEIQGVNDIVRVFQQILEIGLRFRDLARALEHFDFKGFAVLVQLPFQPFALGDIPQLHHNVRHGSCLNARQIELHRYRTSGPIQHLHLHRRCFARLAEDLMDQGGN